MSIRFAAPPHAIRNRMDRTSARRRARAAANDNPSDQSGEAALHAALRHFARHGLAAARHARLEAEQARAAGDEQGFAWWLDICRTLDRRMAQDIARQALL